MPTVRRTRIKSSEFYKVRGDVATVRPLVAGIFDELMRHLTEPLKPEETAPPEQERDTDGPAILTIAAPTVDEAWEAFNADYLAREWGDGLPLVPPTREKVNWMLSGTTRAPDEVLGKINPKHGIVTVEKVAVNAVMAGARPEYLPVIIAAVETMADPDFDDLHVLASAGSFSLMVCVSGPIGKELGMNSGIGFLGHGFRANNTIGRALRLTTLNCGRTWPGKNDMALTGRVSPHTFYTFAENPDGHPWPPYHTTLGLAAEDSAVTVATIFGHSPISQFYGGMIGTWTAESVLDTIVATMIRFESRVLFQWGFKGMGPLPGSGWGANHHLVILFPELVAELQRMGFDRASLQQEIYRRAVVPYEELPEPAVKGMRRGIETGVVPPDRVPVFEAALQPGQKVPVLMSPEMLRFFVAGGAPGCAFSFAYTRLPPYQPTALMTTRIRGATLTTAGS